jgi:hypothetical protein
LETVWSVAERKNLKHESEADQLSLRIAAGFGLGCMICFWLQWKSVWTDILKFKLKEAHSKSMRGGGVGGSILSMNPTMLCQAAFREWRLVYHKERKVQTHIHTKSKKTNNKILKAVVTFWFHRMIHKLVHRGHQEGTVHLMCPNKALRSHQTFGAWVLELHRITHARLAEAKAGKMKLVAGALSANSQGLGLRVFNAWNSVKESSKRDSAMRKRADVYDQRRDQLQMAVCEHAAKSKLRSMLRPAVSLWRQATQLSSKLRDAAGRRAPGIWRRVLTSEEILPSALHLWWRCTHEERGGSEGQRLWRGLAVQKRSREMETVQDFHAVVAASSSAKYRHGAALDSQLRTLREHVALWRRQVLDHRASAKLSRQQQGIEGITCMLAENEVTMWLKASVERWLEVVRRRREHRLLGQKSHELSRSVDVHDLAHDFRNDKETVPACFVIWRNSHVEYVLKKKKAVEKRMKKQRDATSTFLQSLSTQDICQVIFHAWQRQIVLNVRADYNSSRQFWKQRTGDMRKCAVRNIQSLVEYSVDISTALYFLHWYASIHNDMGNQKLSALEASDLQQQLRLERTFERMKNRRSIALGLRAWEQAWVQATMERREDESKKSRMLIFLKGAAQDEESRCQALVVAALRAWTDTRRESKSAVAKEQEEEQRRKDFCLRAQAVFGAFGEAMKAECFNDWKGLVEQLNVEAEHAQQMRQKEEEQREKADRETYAKMQAFSTSADANNNVLLSMAVGAWSREAKAELFETRDGAAFITAIQFHHSSRRSCRC